MGPGDHAERDITAGGDFMEFFEWVGQFLAMLVRSEWSRIIVFSLFGIWLFSYLLWDFILAMIKQYELMMRGESNVMDFKREVQSFVGVCVLIGWGFYFLFNWFQEPELETWLVGGAAWLVAAWFNRSLTNRWIGTVWEAAKPNSGTI